ARPRQVCASEPAPLAQHTLWGHLPAYLHLRPVPSAQCRVRTFGASTHGRTCVLAPKPLTHQATARPRAAGNTAQAAGCGPRPPGQDLTEVCCWAPSGSPSPVPPSPPSSSTRPSPRSLESTTGPIAIRPATTAMAIRNAWFASAGTLSATTAGAISTETRFITLTSGLIAGPAVSLNGSPMVSPITVASCASEFFPP